MNQASKFIPCCFFYFLMCSRIIKYISFIPNFLVLFLEINGHYDYKIYLHLTMFHVKCKLEITKRGTIKA